MKRFTSVLAVAGSVLFLMSSASFALPIVDQTGNILINGNFEQEDGWKSRGWATGNDFLTLVNDPLMEGNFTGLVSANTYWGIRQYADLVAGTYTVSGWVNVDDGEARVGLSTSSGSAVYLPDVTTLDSWQYLSLTRTFTTAFTGGVILYGGADGSNFYVDGFWLNAGTTSTSPYDPSKGFSPGSFAAASSQAVPEPGTLLLLGCGMIGLGILRKRTVKRG